MNKPSRIGAAILGLAGIVTTAAEYYDNKNVVVDEPLLRTGVVKRECWGVTKDGKNVYWGAHHFSLDLGTVVYDFTVDEPKQLHPLHEYGNGTVICLPISSKLIEEGDRMAAETAKHSSSAYPVCVEVRTKIKDSDIKIIAPKPKS